MRKLLYIFLAALIFCACQEEKEHIAGAINDRDSVSMMRSYGVNTLISDSGIMKYRIVAEEWEVNTVKNPSRWIFPKGIFLQQFDQSFHIEAYVQADTAYYFDQQHLWHLIGRVRVRTVDGVRFSSEELFWDQQRHEFYSHRFSHLITPERTMQGTYFRSDEQMTKYLITNSKGSFESAAVFGDDNNGGSNTGDSTSEYMMPMRPQDTPRPKE